MPFHSAMRYEACNDAHEGASGRSWLQAEDQQCFASVDDSVK